MAGVITPHQLLAPKKSYSDKLRDPKWKSFRSEYVKKRGAWCESCKRIGIQADLHHLAYEQGREPWEYSYEEVCLFCRDCHDRWHKLVNGFKLTTGRLNLANLTILLGALSVIIRLYDIAEFSMAICQLAAEKHTIQRLKMSWEQGDKEPAPREPGGC